MTIPNLYCKNNYIYLLAIHSNMTDLTSLFDKTVLVLTPPLHTMIRKHTQKVIRPPRKRLYALSLALLLWLLLPLGTQAQDVAFSLSQQVVADTLEVTLSGQSLDTQPDTLMGFVLNLSADPCLDFATSEIQAASSGQLNGYLRKVVGTSNGMRLAIFQNASNPAFLTLGTTTTDLLILKLPFDPSVCSVPTVQLLNSSEDRIIDHLHHQLTQ